MFVRFDEMADGLIRWGRQAGTQAEAIRNGACVDGWTAVDRVALVRIARALERIVTLVDPEERARLREQEARVQEMELRGPYLSVWCKETERFLEQVPQTTFNLLRREVRDAVTRSLLAADLPDIVRDSDLPDVETYRAQLRAALAAFEWPAAIGRPATRKQQLYAEWRRTCASAAAGRGAETVS